MKTVFLTNYCTHHQVPFCNAMYEKLGDDFHLAVMRRTEEEQKSLGYKELNNALPYIIRAYEGKEKFREVEKLCETADVVIQGATPQNFNLNERLAKNKLTFVYTERRFKKGMIYALYPPMTKFMYKRYTVNRNREQYYLCAGGYVKRDINIFTHTPEKFFKWGYFPETKRYDDIDKLIAAKDKNSIIWVARYIDCKHPEIAVKLVKKLKNAGYEFKLTMLGNGVLLDKIREKVKSENLSDRINILGAVPSDEVRGHMEKSEIHIFTSDRNEGWGAVTNEAMNSACVTVSDRRIGATPFLIDNGENGFTYKNFDDLYKKVKFLLDNPQKRREISINAYKTITEKWNAETAAGRFLALASAKLNGENVKFESGPCSRA